MDIISRINETKANFTQRINIINEKKNIISQAQNDIAVLDAEANQFQGEFRVLIELGQEQGLVDASGNIIPKEQKEGEDNGESK